ncbi:MAG: hypothetical protein HY738_01495 [Bacteroidia bacterium]|nr:hypothetical protein [Bacteroidia bacterium]
MKKLIKLSLVILTLCYVTVTKNVITQIDTTFWNPDMIAIAKPLSTQKCVYLKNGINIEPNNLFTAYKTAFGLDNNDEMFLKRTETDQLGYTHYRYQQKYKGINVEWAEYIVHVMDGYVEKANGKIIRGLNLNINPLISENEALNIALSFINATVYMWEDVNEEQLLKEFKNDNSATYYPQAELVISREGENLDLIPRNFLLAYKFDIYAQQPMSRNHVYVDAINGDVILVMNRIHSNDVQGTAITKYSGTQTITTDSQEPHIV